MWAFSKGRKTFITWLPPFHRLPGAWPDSASSCPGGRGDAAEFSTPTWDPGAKGSWDQQLGPWAWARKGRGRRSARSSQPRSGKGVRARAGPCLAARPGGLEAFSRGPGLPAGRPARPARSRAGAALGLRAPQGGGRRGYRTGSERLGVLEVEPRLGPSARSSRRRQPGESSLICCIVCINMNILFCLFCLLGANKSCEFFLYTKCSSTGDQSMG